MSEKNLVFLGGVPTDIDLQKLKDAFGIPKEGDIITYENISEILRLDQNSNRWKTVTNRWRKQLRKIGNIEMKSQRGICFECLDASKRVVLASEKFRSGLKTVSKASTIAAVTDRSKLSQSESKICDHIQITGAQLKLHAITASKNLSKEFKLLEISPKVTEKARI